MNNMNRYLLIAMASGMAFFSGCSTVNSIERETPQATPNYIKDRRLVFDGWLAESIEVTGLAQTYVSGNLLKIDMQVRNLHRHYKDYRYRIEWIGQDGMAIPSPIDGWKTFHLEGREATHISATATSPKAVDFIIKFMLDHE